MNEAQRQSALQAMGIQSYFPRFRLPGAAPSRQAEVDAAMFGLESEATARRSGDRSLEEILAGFEDETPVVSAAEAPARPQRAETSRPAESTAIAPPAPASAALGPETAVAAAAPVETPRLKLCCIMAGEGLVLVNEMPLSAGDQLSAAHTRLMAQISLALGVKDAESAARGLFRWPMLDMPGVDNSAAAALDTLFAYLEELGGGSLPLRLVVMGEMLGETLFGGDLPVADMAMVRTRNLDQLLRMPAFKRELWQALRQLRT